MDYNASQLGNREFLEKLSTDELKKLADTLSLGTQQGTDFRLTDDGMKLTKELKDEWRDCMEYCKKRRQENWKSSGVQGVSEDKSRQERMKLPRLVEAQAARRFGSKWQNEKTASEWLWETYPQFRLVEKR